MLRLPIFATAAIVAALLAYWQFGFAGEQRKLRAIEGDLPARGNYLITLDFSPERFHQLFLQEKGRLVEVRDHTVYMMDVTPEALRDIARRYWVDSVERWSGK